MNLIEQWKKSGARNSNFRRFSANVPGEFYCPGFQKKVPIQPSEAALFPDILDKTETSSL